MTARRLLIRGRGYPDQRAARGRTDRVPRGRREVLPGTPAEAGTTPIEMIAGFTPASVRQLAAFLRGGR